MLRTMTSKINIIIISSILSLIFIVPPKKQSDFKNEGVTTICVRDSDTLYIKITNNSEKSIYIPSSYEGIYNLDNDSVFIEAIGRPRFNTEKYHMYSKLFPFVFFTVRKIENVEPDTIEEAIDQTYYFNQFLVGDFEEVMPNSSCIKKIVFYVPNCARKVNVAYYDENFHIWKGGKNVNYNLGDFLKFDSLFLNYSSSNIYNAYYISPQK